MPFGVRAKRPRTSIFLICALYVHDDSVTHESHSTVVTTRLVRILMRPTYDMLITLRRMGIDRGSAANDIRVCVVSVV